METLQALLKKWPHGWYWIGARPEGRDSHLPRIIAAQIGLPTAADDPIANGGLIELTMPQAAHVLAVTLYISLAYGGTPRKGQLAEAKATLAAMGPGARFFSNGLWELGGPFSWQPLTDATFDCGLIGYDADSAFIVWRPEED